jgi:integrase
VDFVFLGDVPTLQHVPGSAYDLRMAGEFRPPTGHVFRVERARGPVWYAKYRLPDGRQVQKKLGPAWTERGRPPAGYHTKRLAEDWLRETLDAARCGTLPGMVRTGATFADAAAEYLRYVEHDRGRKPSTLRGYRSTIDVHLLPAFGPTPVEDVTTPVIETWLAGFECSVRARNKVLIQLGGILGRAKKVYRLPANAASEVEKFQQRASGDIQVFWPEEVWALVWAAESEQDAAVFLTAAFTGLRMGELLALRWRDVDFTGNAVRVRASYYLGQLTTPKSGKVRAVPLAPAVAAALAPLSQRQDWVGDDDLVFVGPPAATSMGPRSAAGTRRRLPRLGCVVCASTICGTRSGRG